MRIEPTVGRMVWYWPSAHDAIGEGRGNQPLSGQIAHVNGDGTVNLLVLSVMGYPQQRLAVPLVQSSDEHLASGHATWMPYQIGQARKEADNTASFHRGELSGARHTSPPAGDANAGDAPPRSITG